MNNTKSKNDSYAVRYDQETGEFVYMNDDELLMRLGVYSYSTPSSGLIIKQLDVNSPR